MKPQWLSGRACLKCPLPSSESTSVGRLAIVRPDVLLSQSGKRNATLARNDPHAEALFQRTPPELSLVDWAATPDALQGFPSSPICCIISPYWFCQRLSCGVMHTLCLHR